MRSVPEARLDIYGDGTGREALQAEIDRRQLGASVTLHGFDPEARDALWRSSAFLMTSLFEGYPLSTLESMSCGCPVVSYDIKYGPREQITDGVDGFLVPRGDVDGLADRIVELLQSPELVSRMSAAARETAARHGADHFLADWADVLERVVELRPDRTRIDDVALETTRLRRVRGDRLQFAAVLRVKASTPARQARLRRRPALRRRRRERSGDRAAAQGQARRRRAPAPHAGRAARRARRPSRHAPAVAAALEQLRLGDRSRGPGRRVRGGERQLAAHA